MINTFCPKCNNPLTFEDSHAGMQGQCDKCNSVLTVPSPMPGYGVQPNYAPPPQQTGNGKAVASFVCALIGFFIAGIILGIIAISLGSAALKNPRLKGLAIAGIIIGIIDIIAAIIVLAVLRPFR